MSNMERGTASCLSRFILYLPSLCLFGSQAQLQEAGVRRSGMQREVRVSAAGRALGEDVVAHEFGPARLREIRESPAGPADMPLNDNSLMIANVGVRRQAQQKPGVTAISFEEMVAHPQSMQESPRELYHQLEPTLKMGASQVVNTTEDAPGGYVYCHNAGEAYAAAYLTSANYFVETPMPDHGWNEFGSGFYMFGQLNPATAYHRAVRTTPLLDFFVEHLTGIDYHIKYSNSSGPRAKKYVKEISEKAAGVCDHVGEMENMSSKIVTVIPFWGGDDGSSAQIRLNHLHGTICSVGAHFGEVVVGACNDYRRVYDNLTDVQRLRQVKFAIPVQVVGIECERGSNLITRIQRHAQKQLKTGVWQHKYVFYTEGDHVFHLGRSARSMLNDIDRNPSIYIVPTRLNEAYEGKIAGNETIYNMPFDLFKFDERQFVLHGVCRAPRGLKHDLASSSFVAVETNRRI